jgi:hypothetical protein
MRDIDAYAATKLITKGVNASTGLVTNAPNRLVNTLTRPLGLEVELSDWKNLQVNFRNPKYAHYRVTRDSSVKPSETEMVLSPLAGDTFVAAMLELSQALLDSEAQVNETCGFHVHVNATDYNPWAVRRLLWTYMTIEPALYATMLAPHRLNSRHCQPLQKDMQMVSAVAKMMQAKSAAEIKEELSATVYDWKPQEVVDKIETQFAHAITSAKTAFPKDSKQFIANWKTETQLRMKKIGKQIHTERANKYGNDGRAHMVRYYGLNLHSLTHRGTIEFRMKEGTTNLTELMFGPLWCGWFVDTCSRVSDQKLFNSTPPITLNSFTRTYMPAFLADWVDKQAEASVVATA